MPEYYIKDIVEKLSIDILKDALEELESDDATDLLKEIEEIDAQKAHELLEKLDEEDKQDIKKLRRYDENQAGAYIQTEVFKACYEESIQQAIDKLKREKNEGELENIHQLFVVDNLGRLMFLSA